MTNDPTYDEQLALLKKTELFHFELTTSPNVIWADLAKFNLAPGAPVLVLSPDNIALSGEVSGKFRKAAKAPF